MAVKSTTKTECPNCGNMVLLLHDLDEMTQSRLKNEANISLTYSTVCTSCYKTLCKKISSGTYLNSEKQIQSDVKKNLWNSRLSLLKKARACTEADNYAEAASNYEKYLKVIEFTYGVKRSSLTPQTFKDRPREISLVVAALWALVEIYDIHAQYHPRQEEAANLLGKLIGYTNMYTQIVKAASVKRRTANNPNAFKAFLSSADVSTVGCFIASAAFQDRDHPTMIILCAFRDQVLVHNSWGRSFTNWYYANSPSLANELQHIKWVRKVLKTALPLVAACLNWLFSLNADSKS